MNSNLVTIAQFDDPANANLVLGVLTSAEIDAVLANETMVGVAWHLSNAVGGIRLQVREEDVDRARVTLEEDHSFEQDPEIPDGYFEEKEIENPDDVAREKLVRRAFISGVISLTMHPLIIYTMVLVGRAFAAEGKLKPWSKFKLIFAACVGPVVIITSIFLFSTQL